MTISPFRAAVLATVAFAAAAVRGAELPIIAKARAYLGGEAALSSVQSIHYVGKIVGPDPTDAKKQTTAAIEIIVQRPYQYRVTVTSDQVIDTTALDGYDGWNRKTAVADPKRWQQTLLGGEQIKRLRANAWENIAFFGGAATSNVSIEDRGPAQIDGVACEKVAFVHSPNIAYTRYFDVNTGKLIFSETESGGTIREQGEMVVNGIKFPKVLVSTSKGEGTSGPQTVTITFDKIILNEKMLPSFFAVPSLGTR